MTEIRECILNIKPYIPGKPIEEVQREYGLKKVIKLASNENPLGPSPKVIQAIVETASRVHMYPDGRGYYLKQALMAHWGVTEDNLFLGNGSDETIKLLGEVYLNPGDNIVQAKPAFSEYAYAANLMGADVIEVPVDQSMTHDLPAMAAAVTSKTKLVFICNPNNPTGTIVGREDLEKFLDTVPNDVLVVLDEAYAEYAERADFPRSLRYVEEGRNVIILRTFSKAYALAGLRLGYAIANPSVINELNRVREPFSVNLMAQKAGIASLSDQAHLEATLQNNREGKKYLYACLTEMGLSYLPTESNFIFINLGTNCRPVFEALLKRGVIIRTGDAFGYPEWIRLTIGRPEENQIFIHHLKEILGK